ncbi:MAG: Na+/H+ antiporter subunit E [Bacillota bacterium]
MFRQLVVNILIAYLWTLLMGEWNWTIFSVGYLIGSAVVFALRHFFPQPYYLKKVWAIIRFIYVLIREILTSGIFVMGQVIRPQPTFMPGIFSIKSKLQGNIEITIISLMITLTPGSTVMEYSPEENILYIHAMDLSDEKRMMLKSIHRFENAIMGVTRDV